MHDHHQLVPLRAVPDGQLDLPQRGLSQGGSTGETQRRVSSADGSEPVSTSFPLHEVAAKTQEWEPCLNFWAQMDQHDSHSTRGFNIAQLLKTGAQSKIKTGALCTDINTLSF